MAFGLTATGFARKTVRDILDEIEAAEKLQIDARLNVQPEEPIGQLNGILASKLGELWEALEAVNAGRFPDTASGFQLDQVASITGTLRAQATKGTVTLTVGASGATTIPAGSIAQVLGDDSNRWVTLADVVFTEAGAKTVDAEAETAGAVSANASTITVIATPVASWTSVTNAGPATPGTDVDTDAQLRIRRENELARAGSSTLDAIRADVLDVEDVTSVSVFHNPTNATDSDGLPPHAVEVLVIGGDDQDIRDGILATVAAGIGTFGTTTGTADDSQGQTHTVRFSRPTEIDILVVMSVRYDPRTYPSNGDELVADAVAAYIAGLPVGNDVFLSQVNAAALRDTSGEAIAGIIDVFGTKIGSVAPSVPVVASNYTLTPRELATVSDVANITISSFSGTA